MITDEITVRIRRLYYAEHWRVGTIASELGVHHTTVVRALNRAQLVGATVRRMPSSVLDPYKPVIADVLERHPRLRATRLHAMLQGRGYPGGVLAVRRYVRTVRPRRAEAFLRLQTLPGEQGQVDWGHFGKITVGHARRPLVCFVLALSWSRAVYARFALDQSLESFLRGHVARLRRWWWNDLGKLRRAGQTDHPWNGDLRVFFRGRPAHQNGRQPGHELRL